MSIKREKVVFYFPWKELSGGPFYLTKLADDLALSDDFEVFYVDYKNGLSDSMLTNPRVNKIEYNDNNFVLPFGDPVTIITPIYWAHRIPKINNDSKIVFLNWHYCCTPVLKNDSGWSKVIMNRFLSLVSKTNSCFFLDYSHLLGQNTKKIKFKENYVPIKLKEKEQKANVALTSENEINLGVLGRLDGDKVFSVINLLDNLANLNSEKKINLHVIGDGVHRQFFEDTCKQENYKEKNINIIMYGTVTGDELNNLMAQKFDVLFAMGTSVIEGAAIALPSVIIASNTQRFYDNKYVYFQNSINYCLGWFNTQIPQLDIKTIEIKEIIDDIYNKNLKEELGKKAYEYYCNNHKDNIDKFIYAINDSKLKYHNMKNIYLLRSLLNNLISLRNNNDKKILRLLGLKFTFKRKKFIEQQEKNQRFQTIKGSVSTLQEEFNKKQNILLQSLCYQTNLYNKVQASHSKVFSKYKNIHNGETAVLIASGPTVNQFNPEILKPENPKYIAVNGSFAFDKVDFDYLFLQDYSGLKESVSKIPNASNLKKAEKFYGVMSPTPANMLVPESIINRDNANKYYVHSVCYDNGKLLPIVNYALDLSSEFFMCHGTIPLVAMQFLLYAGFKTIYLVGCDCSISGHFSENMEKQVTLKNELDVWLLGWRKMKEFAQIHYPDVEIISINPVGLQGYFKEIYTEN